MRSQSPQATSVSQLMSRHKSTRCAPSRRRAPEQRVLWKRQQVAQRSAGEGVATGGVEHREAIQRFRQQRRKGLRGEHGRGLRLHDLGRHTSWPRGLSPRRSQPFRRAAARWARARRLPAGVEHRRHSARTERGVQRPRDERTCLVSIWRPFSRRATRVSATADMATQPNASMLTPATVRVLHNAAARAARPPDRPRTASQPPSSGFAGSSRRLAPRLLRRPACITISQRYTTSRGLQLGVRSTAVGDMWKP